MCKLPVACLLLVALGSTLAAEVALDRDGEAYRMILRDDALTAPLVFDGGRQGPFHVQIDGKRHDLSEAPVSEVTENGVYTARWELDGHPLRLKVTPAKTACRIELRGMPESKIEGWGVSLLADADEYFTGLMARVVDGKPGVRMVNLITDRPSWRKGIETAMDLRGQRMEMMVKPTMGVYTPFYLSSRNYSIFVEGTWPGVYDFCKEDPERVTFFFEGQELNMILDVGKPAALISRQSLRVGPTIVPPKWAFGHWRWRDNVRHKDKYYDGTASSAPVNTQIAEDIMMMGALDIPFSVYWIDRPWAKGKYGFEDYEWDLDRIPNPERMIDWINGKGAEFLLWIAPWTNGEMTRAAKKRGYTIPGQVDFHGYQNQLIDFTNPEARRWWQEEGPGKMLRQGVAGFKLDRADEVVPYGYDHAVFDGRCDREHKNAYPVEYMKAVHEICEEIRGDDFALLARAAYTGSAKYGTVWGGDHECYPESLRAAIIGLQRAAVIGFPIWGSDTGGYWHGGLDREVCARWLAFSCFSPIMEVGPTADRAFWDMPKEPHYDVELLAIWRLYARLHTNLIEHSHGYVQEARKTGMPVVRPLFLLYPDQPEAWKDWQTYQYGPDLLVSAIWKKGTSDHSLYLPAGEIWVDAWDPTQELEGGRTITVDAPLHKMPIFLRKGSGLDLGDLKALYQESLEVCRVKPGLGSLQAKEFPQER